MHTFPDTCSTQPRRTRKASVGASWLGRKEPKKVNGSAREVEIESDQMKVDSSDQQQGKVAGL